ncbi:MAG: hypothetical protein A2W91_03920 [Bacteroidetes bacterium GWF2_38_335]|nr:MAG: hypothetical protein A2W91_03920 [Bacteroidetes bacterium GWF2_38_335]OFY79100.1 MAG: hypothetical protein A2281_03255 [Bacteroidetes bacterium RIFOXYA12_FULL_38_20]HBS88816.1 hypothetical protein [Bacteroidales bacterium]
MRKEKSIGFIIFSVISMLTSSCINCGEEHTKMKDELIIKAPNNSDCVFISDQGDTNTYVLTYKMDGTGWDESMGCEHSADILIVTYQPVFYEPELGDEIIQFNIIAEHSWGLHEYDRNTISYNGKLYNDVLIDSLKSNRKYFYSFKYGLLKFIKDSVQWELNNFNELFPEGK